MTLKQRLLSRVRSLEIGASSAMRFSLSAAVVRRPLRFGHRLRELVDDYWQNLVRATFGLFVGGLVALLVLLYAGVPLI
jgi:hypothetical protein